MAKSTFRTNTKVNATAVRASDKVKRIRVFAIESPSAMDLLANRAETRILEPVCKLLGHDFASTVVRSKAEFETALNHITSINVDEIPNSARSRPLCLHIAAHRNENGLALGSQDAKMGLSWQEALAVLAANEGLSWENPKRWNSPS